MVDFLKLYKDYDIDNTNEFSFTCKEDVCRLIDIYDGDTVTVIIPINKEYWQYRIRIHGINTPEIRTLDLDEKEKGYKARQRVIELLCGEDTPLTTESSKKEIQAYLKSNIFLVWLKCYDFCSFGRILADVYSYNQETGAGQNVAEVLLKENLCEVYTS